MALMQDLPEVIPVFPLSGVLLLPRAMLPLHIFEPRYRAMTRDALAGDRMIGMIQPRDGDGEGDDDNPGIYEVGCLGAIVRSRALDDGRYAIALQGVSRFRVGEELELHETGYRRIQAEFEDFRGDLDGRRDAAVDREALLAALGAFLDRRSAEADWEAVRKADDETLVNALCMGCPFTASEKQALLETADTAARAETLTTLFAMSAFEGEEPPQGDELMADEIDPKLLELLVCPVTKGPLRLDREAGELVSVNARLAFPIRDGIPIMLVDEARELGEDEGGT